MCGLRVAFCPRYHGSPDGRVRAWAGRGRASAEGEAGRSEEEVSLVDPLRGTLDDLEPTFGNSESELRLFSQNMWCHHLVPAPGRLARVRGLLRNLAARQPRYDVVMLQEMFLFRMVPFVWLKREVDVLCAEMRKLGYLYHTDPMASTSWRKPQNSGLITFSRMPIRASRFVPFERTSELLNNKGFEHVLIDLNGKRVHLFNTHLDSRAWSFRRRQIDQIKQAVRNSTASSNDAVVVAGDFNVCVNNEARNYSYLARTMASTEGETSTSTPTRLHDSFGDRGVSTFRDKPSKGSLYLQQLLCDCYRPRWPQNNNFVALDHMFHSRDFLRLLEKQVLDYRMVNLSEPISDHLGIYAHYSVVS